MKKTNGIRAVLCIVIAAVTSDVSAQMSAPVGASASTSGGAAVAASGGTSAKAVRQANRALRRKVYAALAQHKEIDAGSISVTAKGGAVTLNGTVAEASQIETVGNVAKSVAGVTSVTNKISIQRPLGQ
ncbi:BON domain-containing protein [Burkholderia sp. Bp8998]|nr:BON domain-containing protein [Burkholderia sp. Bp8998]